MLTKVKKFAVSAGAFAGSAMLPLVALAQQGPREYGTGANQDPTKVVGLISLLANIVKLLTPVAVAAALLFFIWGLAQFIMASGDEEKKDEGKRKMIWGVIALFVIVSIFGIIAWIGGVLGVGQGGDLPAPGVDFNI